MDDLISRQAAIDLIESIETERLKGNIELIYAPAIKGLRALPPANCSEFPNNSDTISRQAAIDLLKQMRKDGDMIPWEGKDVFARIRKLPPAQPEIIRCKDCKYFKQVFAPNDNDGLCGHWHSKCDARTNRNGYCSHAERREDTE